MTQEEQQVLIIKGTIADLPEDQRSKVMEQYKTLKAMMEDTPLTGLAIALLGAELCV